VSKRARRYCEIRLVGGCSIRCFGGGYELHQGNDGYTRNLDGSRYHPEEVGLVAEGNPDFVVEWLDGAPPVPSSPPPAPAPAPVAAPEPAVDDRVEEEPAEEPDPEPAEEPADEAGGKSESYSKAIAGRLKALTAKRGGGRQLRAALESFGLATPPSKKEMAGVLREHVESAPEDAQAILKALED